MGNKIKVNHASLYGDMVLIVVYAHNGATIQSPRGGGGYSIFKINILRLNFHEINNCLKDML